MHENLVRLSKYIGNRKDVTGRITRPDNDDHYKAVLLVHGYGSNKECDSNVYLARELAQCGVATLAIDLSGHQFGKIEEQRLSDFIDDVHLGIDKLFQKGYHSVGIFANSIGALITTEALKQRESTKGIYKIGFKSPVVDLEAAVKRKYGASLLNGNDISFEYDGRKFSVPSSLFAEAMQHRLNGEKYAIPAHVSFGLHDELVTFSEIKLLLNVFSPSGAVSYDAGHDLVIDGDGERAMKPFVDWLAGKNGQRN
jgi:esterase/lipase